MKSEQEFDQIFRQKLYGAEVTPPAFVWPEVEKAIRSKRRRGIIWWFLGGGSLMLAIAGWYFVAAPANPQVVLSERAAEVEQTLGVTPASTLSESAVQSSATTSSSIPTESGKGRWSPKGVAASRVSHSASLLEAELPADFRKHVDGCATEGGPNNNTGWFTIMDPLPLAPEGVVTGAPAAPTFKKWPVNSIVRKKKEKNDQCYDFETHKSAWMLETYAGPLYAKKQLEAGPSPENDQYLTQRIQTEGPGWGFNAGARATYLFAERYAVSAGLDYQQYAEVFEYADPTSIEYIIKQVLDVQTGVWKIDTIDVNFGEERTRVINRFGTLDIPFSAGYEWRNGRSGIRFQGGGAVNLYFWKRGAVMDPQTGAPGYFTPGTGSQEVFRVRTGLSVQGGVQAFWHLEPRTRLFAEPNFRMQLDPITSEQHPLSQRNRLWSLRLGITRIF